MTDMAANPKAFTVSLIGAGYFAGFHADGWRRNPDAEVIAVVDSDIEKAQQLASAHCPQAKLFANAGQMFAKLYPDIVDIAAPPATHFGLIELALASTARAVVCQKPFCGDLRTARRSVALIEASAKTVVVHENFRFQPWYREIRRQVDAGRVGEIYQVTFRLRPGDGQGREAYLARQPYFQSMERFLIHETGVHFIDTFRFLLGEPSGVMADLRRLNPVIAGEDAGMFVFKYDDGRRAIFDGNRLVDHCAESQRLTMGELTVEGSRAVLTLNGDGEIRLREIGARDWSRIDFELPETGFGGDCVFALQSHVTRHLRHGIAVENSATDYLRNMEIEEAIYRSAAEGVSVDLNGGPR